MSILQDISKRLLDVSNVPPEKRNDALMQVLIYIETVQYDMVLEQKNLIMSVIEDLIAENDAEQIVKSKLVFVEDVEEQIAPTKKTRAKKVVTPVGGVILEDLPDTINPDELVGNLPDQVLKLAILRNKQEGRNEIPLNQTLMSAFNWSTTPEGVDFWSNISDFGALVEFKRVYGNKGEKVDEVIEFAELNEFVEGLSQPSASGDLPDFINKLIPISQLPEPIIKLFDFRRKELGLKGAIDKDGYLSQLNWDIAPEGYDFWDKISNDGNLIEFKKLYGNKGEGVDAIINQSALTQDLPDTIDKLTPIKDLPEPVKKLAILRHTQLVTKPIDVNDVLARAFDWTKTPEGDNFWMLINTDGNLTEFKKKYGNKGEGVDAIINAPAVKTRKPRTPKAPVVAPVVATQKLLFLRLIFNPPVGSAIKLEVYNPEELHYAVISILNKLDVVSLFFNFEAVTDFSSYLTKEKLYYHYEPIEIVEKLIETFDKFVTPELDWSDFDNAKTDFNRIEDNKFELYKAFKQAKSITRKPIPVVAPKVVTPKPVKVVTPKVVTPKPVKVVAPKVVKTKVTKPKVEDDLSFLDDLNNIF